MKKHYWTGIDELRNTEAFQQSLTTEMQADPSVDEFLADERLKETSSSRRDFLKFMGFSITAATLAACETPVVKSIPYVTKPDEITPGVANWYASTYYDGHDYGNILVKTREGRPIYIKGNSGRGWWGAINSRINASVIELYDSARLRNPVAGGKETSWASLDAAVKSELETATNIRILSGTIISPSTQRAINEFSAKYAGKVKHVQWDTVSYSGITRANAATHGKAAIPSYDFSKAKVVVGIGCDFLGTWLTPNVYAAQYGELRKPANGWMGKHYHFEANLSLTGSNADERYPVKPSQEGKVAAAILASVVGGSAVDVEGVDPAVLRKIADELKSNGGAALVVAGSNDPDVQIIVNAINQATGSYGKTIDIEKPLNLFRGSDSDMQTLVEELNAGSVDALLVMGTNPSYSWFDKGQFNSGLTKVKTSVSFALYADETATRCKYIAPSHHYLESWNDYSPIQGQTDFAQPAITPLYNTRYAQESLLTWADNNTTYYDYLRTTYNTAYSPGSINSDENWNMAVHNGTLTTAAPVAAVVDANSTAAVAELNTQPVNVDQAVANVTAVKAGTWELSLYQKVTMGAGHHANNPYLQETPDPLTKVTWDNYITMNPLDVEAMGLSTAIGLCDCANVAKVTVGGKSITLPIFPSPGQKRNTIGIALGYGRGEGNEAIGNACYQTGRKGNHLTEKVNETEVKITVGRNAYPLAAMVNGSLSYFSADIKVEATTEEYSLATTQMQATVMGRTSVVKETVISDYLSEKDKARGTASFNLIPTFIVHEDVNGDNEINNKDRKHVGEFDLWNAHPVENVGHRWGVTVDLSSCIGCGSCITACHTENNVPVVGKDEVLRHRDMHWMRIDRYFSSDFPTVEETSEKKNLGTISAYRDMEHPEENPETVYMPMFCQHCNHAPCETVCPVAATVHSNEGLNNMAYNRCIGTRYCANNCPYKVRRFNWFNYVGNDKFAMVNPAQDDMMRMVLNPDVTVRTRGVMEKCSMCQQRIQAIKVASKDAGTAVPDSSKLTACAEACPTNAITFGDLNDKNSKVRAQHDDVRSYYALEEVGTQPNVSYMTKVRNYGKTTA